MSNEEKVEKKQSKRRNRYLKAVKAIQHTALTFEGSNSSGRELTYQQALSILLRHRELKEAKLDAISNEELLNQIEICYKQRANQLTENN